MTDVPEWIDERLDPNLDYKLSQRHVVEVMLDAERPFFSIEQIRARVKPDVTKETVRNRLNELREIDVVAAETYPESITLYYVSHPESTWPLSPEGKDALAYDTPLDTLSTRDFLTLSNPAGIRTLVLAGLQLSLLLFAVGIVTAAFGVDLAVGSDLEWWTAAYNLFGVSLFLLLAERVAREVRSRGWTRHLPSRNSSTPK